MSKKQFSFFATSDDLSEVLKTVLSKTPFAFATAIGEQNTAPSIYRSMEDLRNLSVAAYGDINKEICYLLIGIHAIPNVRYVELVRGGTKQVFDQLSHPESVVLKPGGVLGNFACIVAGQIGTVSSDKWSIDLYEGFRSEFKKQFNKVKSFYVGRLAMKKLESGVRLTSNIKSPEEYDLQL